MKATRRVMGSSGKVVGLVIERDGRMVGVHRMRGGWRAFSGTKRASARTALGAVKRLMG